MIKFGKRMTSTAKLYKCNIELESRKEYFKLWIRKLLVVERATKLLIHLQTVVSLIGEPSFGDAIQHANNVWELIKENRKENETKRKCGNILAEAFQKEEQWDEAHFFTQGNLAANADDMKTLILAMRLIYTQKTLII
jgi:hypothetical protein